MNHKPKKLSGYNVYMKDYFSKFKARNIQEAAKAWEKLDAETKKHYNIKANEENEKLRNLQPQEIDNSKHVWVKKSNNKNITMFPPHKIKSILEQDHVLTGKLNKNCLEEINYATVKFLKYLNDNAILKMKNSKKKTLMNSHLLEFIKEENKLDFLIDSDIFDNFEELNEKIKSKTFKRREPKVKIVEEDNNNTVDQKKFMKNFFN